jgi:hypothetical protein
MIKVNTTSASSYIIDGSTYSSSSSHLTAEEIEFIREFRRIVQTYRDNPAIQAELESVKLLLALTK